MIQQKMEIKGILKLQDLETTKVDNKGMEEIFEKNMEWTLKGC